MHVGRTPEQKSALARELTDAAVRALGVGAQGVEVTTFEIDRGH